MNCKYNFENITAYIDGMLSDEASIALTNHTDTCEKCKNMLRRLQSARDILEEECSVDDHINQNVMRSIDSTRYEKRKNRFKFLKGLYNANQVLKPVFAILLVVVALFVTAVYGNSRFGIWGKNGESSTNTQDLKPFNILFEGGDFGKRDDTVLLVNYDPKRSKINTLSLPRDLYISINGQEKGKLADYLPSVDPALRPTFVGKLLNIDVKYYFRMDYASLEKMLDAVGGVDYNIPFDMNYDDAAQNLHIHLNKGPQHLNGKQVVEFIRFRMPSHMDKAFLEFYDGSDLKRIEAQQKMIREILNQKLSKSYGLDLKSIMTIALSGVQTNLTLSDSLNLLQNVSKINASEMNMMTVPGKTQQMGMLMLTYFIMDAEKTKGMTDQYFTTKE